MRITGLRTGYSTTCSLDDEGDNIAGAKDPEVEFGCKEGCFLAENLDVATEEDVDSSSEKDGSYVEKIVSRDIISLTDTI